MLILNIIEILLLIVILVLVILIWIKQRKEGFDNCFGMQYYGLPFNSNYHNKICAQGTTKPLYKEGGCAVYDPEKISAEYAEGKFTAGV